MLETPYVLAFPDFHDPPCKTGVFQALQNLSWFTSNHFLWFSFTHPHSSSPHWYACCHLSSGCWTHSLYLACSFSSVWELVQLPCPDLQGLVLLRSRHHYARNVEQFCVAAASSERVNSSHSACGSCGRLAGKQCRGWPLTPQERNVEALSSRTETKDTQAVGKWRFNSAFNVF